MSLQLFDRHHCPHTPPLLLDWLREYFCQKTSLAARPLLCVHLARFGSLCSKVMWFGVQVESGCYYPDHHEVSFQSSISKREALTTYFPASSSFHVSVTSFSRHVPLIFSIDWAAFTPLWIDLHAEASFLKGNTSGNQVSPFVSVKQLETYSFFYLSVCVIKQPIEILLK